MKNLLKGILAQNILRHRQHRRFIHNVGAAVLPFAKGRTMLILGALALGSEFLRRRKARNQRIPEYIDV